MTYLGLLRSNDDYRRLWLGQVVSFFGDWFKTVALFVIVQDMTDSARAIAAVLVAKLLPIFLVTPVAGPLVDRFDRRKLMLGTDFARAACAGGLVAAHQLGSLPLLFCVLVVMVAFSGVFIPARTASIPQLVGDRELPVAMALSGGTWSVMLAFGSGVGGVITAWLGVDAALVLDGATYLLSAAFLWRLPPLPPREHGHGAARAGFVEGLRYLRDRPYLASVISLKTAIGLSGAAMVALPAYGNGLFPATAGPTFIGLLYFLRGAGSLVGSMGVRRVTGDDPATLRALIAPGFALAALGLVALRWAPNIWVAGLCFLVSQLGIATVWVFASTLGQLASDRAYRGRVFSLEFAGLTFMMSLSSWLGGELVDRTSLGHPELALASGLALMAPAVAWRVMLAVVRPKGTGRVAAPE